ARRAVTVVRGSHLGDFAEFSGSDDFARLFVLVAGDPLAAYLNDAVGATRCLDDFGAIFDILGHGLFDVDVLAGAERVENDGQVPMIGSGDSNSVNVLP